MSIPFHIHLTHSVPGVFLHTEPPEQHRGGAFRKVAEEKASTIPIKYIIQHVASTLYAHCSNKMVTFVRKMFAIIISNYFAKRNTEPPNGILIRNFRTRLHCCLLCGSTCSIQRTINTSRPKPPRKSSLNTPIPSYHPADSQTPSLCPDGLYGTCCCLYTTRSRTVIYTRPTTTTTTTNGHFKRFVYALWHPVLQRLFSDARASQCRCATLSARHLLKNK